MHFTCRDTCRFEVYNIDRDLPVLLEWLGRSGTCPISVHMPSSSSPSSNRFLEYGDTEAKYHQAMTDALLPHSLRWKDIQSGASSHTLPAICELLSSRSSVLTDLHMDICDLGEELEDGRPRVLNVDLSSVTSLKNVRLDFCLRDGVLVWKGFPPQLRQLHLAADKLLIEDTQTQASSVAIVHLECASLFEFIGVLPVIFPRLEIFTFLIFELRRSDRELAHETVLLLPHLHTLHLSNLVPHAGNAGIASGLLAHMHLPALVKLHLRDPSEEGPGNVDVMSRMLTMVRRSPPPLVSLHIEGFATDAENQERDLLAALRCLPLLNSLTVDYLPMTNAIITALTLPSAADVIAGMPGIENCICPSLRSIFLTGCSVFSRHAVSSMIASRWQDSPLEGDMETDQTDRYHFGQNLLSCHLCIRVNRHDDWNGDFILDKRCNLQVRWIY